MELDKRKLRILQAIIDDYILTAAPVGSRTISKRADFNLSSATIRNEMSDLEEMGYLEQPHTSAGRIPSNKAYRLYVNRIMQRAQLSEQERRAIRAYFQEKTGQVESLLRQTATALSDITRYTAMVLPPQWTAVRIKHIQIVPLSAERALLVLVTDAGLIRDMMIRVPDGITAHDLEHFSNKLNASVRNMRLDQMAVDEVLMMGEDIYSRKMFLQSVIEALELQSKENSQKLELSGAINILHHPEYSDTKKAKEVLAAIESRDTLYQMLKQASTLEFSITIGDENSNEDMKDLSIVTATYRIGNEPMGSFGILGPTRMHYSRVLAILEYMQLSLSEALKELVEQDKQE